SLGLVGVIGLFFWQNGLNALVAMGEISWDVCTSFTLMAVPLFIFMSAVLIESGVSTGLYRAVAKWLYRLPGGLAVASQVACSIFAAVSGSSTATAAAIGMISIPEMEKRGYEQKIVVGSICAGGTLGILIPPSIALIIYGTIMETSIGQLFVAGIIPGIVLALMFSGYIIVRVMLKPSLAPRSEVKVTWKERFTALKGVIPILSLIVLVLGGIYGGIFTPTEAAGVGAFGSVAIAAICRRLNFTVMKRSLLMAVHTTSMIFLIIIGALILSRIVAFLNIPQAFTHTLFKLGLSQWTVFLLVCVLYLIMGCLLDAISMMMITLPVIGPMIVALGFDPVWFGIAMVVLIEMGLITPPVGLNLFVVHGLIEKGRFEIVALGSVPFVILMAAGLALLVFFPNLALWLPSLMVAR
ncbi:MAG: TRAP transporter large permease, partial [Desulfobacteraceae bacterium]|nr:TRAP transporter large permease [Desulfobacteraceae bacterium]